MEADLQGALNQLNKSYSSFEHRGKRMTKDQVKPVLEYGISKGYRSTAELSDEEVDKILNEGVRPMIDEWLEQFLAEQKHAQKQADSDAAVFEEWLQNPDPKPKVIFLGFGHKKIKP
jgi:hypothetical protein